MADSTGHTARNIIQSFNKDVLRELYVNEDIVEDYNVLRGIIHNPESQDKDRISTIKLIWDYTIAKPKQEHDITSGGNPLSNLDMSKLTNEQLTTLATITQSLTDTKGTEQ